MTKYLRTKKLIKKALEKIDTPDDKPSEVFFNIYQKEIEAIIDVINENYIIGDVSNNDSTSPTVFTEWNSIIQEIADEEKMLVDNRILRHLKQNYHPPKKRSGC